MIGNGGVSKERIDAFISFIEKKLEKITTIPKIIKMDIIAWIEYLNYSSPNNFYAILFYFLQRISRNNELIYFEKKSKLWNLTKINQFTEKFFRNIPPLSLKYWLEIGSGSTSVIGVSHQSNILSSKKMNYCLKIYSPLIPYYGPDPDNDYIAEFHLKLDSPLSLIYPSTNHPKLVLCSCNPTCDNHLST